jgi:hypothetical protein
MDKSVKHDYTRQADNLARSAFEEPRVKSTAPDKPKDGDDFMPFRREDFLVVGDKKVGMTVYADRLTKKGGGRINFSLAGSTLLNLRPGLYLTFFVNKSNEWAFSVSEKKQPDSLLISLGRKAGRDANGKKISDTYMCNSKQIATLISKASGIQEIKPIFIPFGKFPDDAGRYHLITRLSKITGREKKTR